MFWKLPRKEFEAGCGETNRRAQKSIVESGSIPGLLAYLDGAPAGWIAVEPRSKYSGLARSRLFKPLDETPVWSVTCFYVDKRYRNQGLTVSLLKAALSYAKSRGGICVEGYPVEPKEGGKTSPVFVYPGLASAFVQAGFREVGRPSPTRPIMRHFLQGMEPWPSGV
jgi:GNAT superfamily N-acetyltransferase